MVKYLFWEIKNKVSIFDYINPLSILKIHFIFENIINLMKYRIDPVAFKGDLKGFSILKGKYKNE
jgi:hypothetical protein